MGGLLNSIDRLVDINIENADTVIVHPRIFNTLIDKFKPFYVDSFAFRSVREVPNFRARPLSPFRASI